MRNLLNFLLKYDYWLLFIFLEAVSFTLLFRFNHYQGSVFFTSANRVVGYVDEMVYEVSSYFGLRSVNRKLVDRNVALELEVKRLKEALKERETDTLLIRQMQRDALRDYLVVPAQVVNNSITRSNNFITIFCDRTN